MKKFYLKISILAFITAFAAIPAAAKVSVDHYKPKRKKI